MTDIDSLLATTEPEPVTSVSTVTPRRCRPHDWTTWTEAGPVEPYCYRCGKVKDIARSRRGKQSRNYGNRAELDVARRYGGTKVGHHGGPVDVRGIDFDTQVKTHRRPPPAEWVKAFAAMAASTERLPRMLVRFVAVGHPPQDFYVIPAAAWLDWYGRDEDAPSARETALEPGEAA